MDPRAADPSPVARRVGDRVGWLIIAAAGFVLAFLVRLVPILRGGGLAGYGSYDDAVYYASAVGLVHGQVPYRDFLLLQPPGIVVLLAPFAALGRLIGETDGFALSRLGWMTMGGLTTVGIALLLRPLGRAAAATGAAFYAVFWPSALVERVTDQEAPQSILLVLALLLLRPLEPVRSAGTDDAHRQTDGLRSLLAGAALGVALGIKIWALVFVLVLAVWLVLRGRLRGMLAMLLGVVIAGAAVYLPFFLTAPGPMWRMVVRDQLGRRRIGGWTDRLAIITGTTALPGPRTLVVAVAVLGFVIAVLLALRISGLRPVLAIYLLLVAVLLAAPPTFIHYGALIGPPAALIIGAAVGELARMPARMPTRRLSPGAGRVLQGALALVVVAALVVLAAQQAGHRYTHRLDTARIGPVVAAATGCITFDSPSPALALGIIGRSIERGCPLVADLGGAAYEPAMRMDRPRARNAAWQRYAVRYLGSGELTLIYRFRTGFGFNPATGRVVRSWPVVARDGALRVRRPQR